MKNQEDPIERLARRTAEENDRLERLRIKEMYEVTPGQRKTALIIGVIGFVLLIVIGLSLVHLLNKPFTGAYN